MIINITLLGAVLLGVSAVIGQKLLPIVSADDSKQTDFVENSKYRIEEKSLLKIH